MSSSSPYIYGIHDPGGEGLLNGRGWVVFTELVSEGGKDYRLWADQGLGVIVRLNYSYGSGTLPPPAQYGEFAKGCAAFVANSPGCTTWIIGNEPNHAQEGKIPFDSYVDGFNQAANAIRRVQSDATVCIAAVAPWNMDAGDWLFYFAQLALGCHCDGIALHTYTHDHDPALITSTAKMQSHPDRHYEFLAYRDFMTSIPADKRHLPVFITETDQDKSWANINSGWAQNAYAEIDWWNQQPGNQQIHCLALYRWPNHDQWGFCDKGGVQDDLRAAVAKGYQWRPSTSSGATPSQPATGLKVGDRVTVVVASVNVRNAPSLQAEVALRLNYGDSFVIEAIYAADGLIWLEGPQGWAAEVAPSGVRLVDKATLSGGDNDRTEIVRRLAAEYGVDEKLARAVIQIESGGSGFRNGRLIMRFEPHMFLRRFSELFVAHFQMGQPVWEGGQHRYKSGDAWKTFHGDQDAEYDARSVAVDMARRAAFDAASYGAGQVMGFNHATVGYPSAEIMAAEFQRSEEAQLRAMFEYFRNRKDDAGKSCLDHLRAGDLVAFAALYNGPGQAEHYAGLIRQALAGGRTRSLAPADAAYELRPDETDDDVAERLYALALALADESEAAP